MRALLIEKILTSYKNSIDFIIQRHLYTWRVTTTYEKEAVLR